MKLTTSTLALFMISPMHSIGSAQTVQKKDLTLDGAKKLIAPAMAETRNENVPRGVAVVDEGGNLIAGAITSQIIL
jgi:hypothetical protein